jgi:hypothetical protein
MTTYTRMIFVTRTNHYTRCRLRTLRKTSTERRLLTVSVLRTYRPHQPLHHVHHPTPRSRPRGPLQGYRCVRPSYRTSAMPGRLRQRPTRRIQGKRKMGIHRRKTLSTCYTRHPTQRTNLRTLRVRVLGLAQLQVATFPTATNHRSLLPCGKSHRPGMDTPIALPHPVAQGSWISPSPYQIPRHCITPPAITIPYRDL